MGLFLGSLFCSIIYESVLMLEPGCFDYSGLVIQFDVSYGYPSSFFFFLKIAAAIWGHLWFHINFWNVYSIFVKYVTGILIEIALIL